MYRFISLILCAVLIISCKNQSGPDESEDSNVLTEYVSDPLDDARAVDQAYDERTKHLNKALDEIEP